MTHGTLTGYHHHKCRCVECQRAHRDYRRRHAASQSAKGICRECREPVSPRSKNFCVDHLDKHRRRMNARNARLRTLAVEQG